MEAGGYQVNEATLVTAAAHFRALSAEIPHGQTYIDAHVHLKGVEKGIIYRQADDLVQQIASQMETALCHLGAVSNASSSALLATLKQYQDAEADARLRVDLLAQENLGAGG